MAATSDPFTGIKLSEQTAVGSQPVARDQRLFAAPRSTPPHPVEPGPAIPAEAVTSQRHDVMTSKRHTVFPRTRTPSPALAPPAAMTVLDLAETPHRDFTLRITDAEYEALDDLERQLRRAHGLTISKNTLIRCGLQQLIAHVADPNRRDAILRKLQNTT